MSTSEIIALVGLLPLMIAMLVVIVVGLYLAVVHGWKKLQKEWAEAGFWEKVVIFLHGWAIMALIVAGVVYLMERG